MEKSLTGGLWKHALLCLLCFVKQFAFDEKCRYKADSDAENNHADECYQCSLKATILVEVVHCIDEASAKYRSEDSRQSYTQQNELWRGLLFGLNKRLDKFRACVALE